MKANTINSHYFFVDLIIAKLDLSQERKSNWLFTGEALSSAKNAITSWRSWFSGIVEEINEEMQGNSMNVEFAVKNSNSREVDSNSEELEHGMLIREEKDKAKPS